jgi:hypothetical protein
MKKTVALLLMIFSLAGCDTFGYQPQPFPIWSPIPSRTPGIVSPTPIIFTATSNVTIITPVTPGGSETPSPTLTTGPATPTEIATATPVLAVQVDILGCNTSIDISHSMGEVTNAYVIVKNTGEVALPNTCALLRAIDEDREHPDKKVCISNLPTQSQVTLKLTVDSVYQQDTAIQVDASSDETLLMRVDRASCTDIGLFGGEPDNAGIVKPIEQ